MKRWTYLILFFCGLFKCKGFEDLLVDTDVGTFQGMRSPDGQYSVFMGIPYGILDEKNPFGISKPYPHLTEIYEAFDDSAICPQEEEFNNTVLGSLDCLRLNIYVPDSASNKNLVPVLVWIHGGNFEIGSAGRYLYGPKYFMKQDIILVTFNYRLGPYGSMCLNIRSVPGNQGLRDQQLALKWVKSNIESFHGDDSKITIAGNGFGGTSADIQLIYGKEKLFDQVILQSGTALYPWWLRQPDRQAPIKLASYLGFSTKNTNDAIEFLSGVPSEEVIAAHRKLNLVLQACIERRFDGVEPFINSNPLSKKPAFGNIKILIGGNSDEGITKYDTMTPDEIAGLNVFEVLLGYSFNFNKEEMKRMVEIVKQYYIGDEPISIDVQDGLIKVFSDFMYNYPTVRTIKKYYDHVDAVYVYMFAYDGELNLEKIRLNLTTPGTAHGDEVTYLFETSYSNGPPSTEAQLVIDRLTTLWANFVKFGNPTPATSDLLPVVWPAVTPDAQYFLNIDNELIVGKRFFGDRMAFWELFYELNNKLEKGYVSEGAELVCGK